MVWRTVRALGIAAAFASVAVGASGGTPAARAQPRRGTAAPGPFQPTMESFAQYRCPEWFRDAKLGIWAVWGVCSVPMQGDWYSRNLYVEGSPQYQYHLAHYGHPSKFGYKDLIPLWRAEKWDPGRLMDLYKKAGARYFCSLAVFCDNTDYWDSRHHRWNSVAMGPHRDIVGEWARAARQRGLRFGVSEHLGDWWHWMETSKGADKAGPLAGVPYDGNDPACADLYATKEDPEDWLARMTDLVDRYHPDFFYTDGPLPFPGQVGWRFLAHFYNQSWQRQGGKVEAIYNCKQPSLGMWVEDLERGVMGEVREHPWQTDTCVGDWHYKESLLQTHTYRTSTLILQMLADIVSKNGNLLLNFPPRPDGTLDEDELRILKEMAAWMPVNGEAIFGTRPWKVYGEGPATVRSGMFNEGLLRYTAQDIRFTTKGKTLYALALGWPADGKLTIRSLGIPAGKVERVSLLGCKDRLRWSQEADGLTVEMPKRKPCDHVYALRIAGRDLKPAPLPPPPPVRPGPDGRIVLPAARAQLHGDTPGYDAVKDNIGWWGDPKDFVSWTFEAAHPGRYTVEIAYSCENGCEGSEFTVIVGGQTLVGRSTSTGSWSTHQTVNLGTIALDRAGPATLTVKPRTPPAWQVIGLHSVTLTPVGP